MNHKLLYQWTEEIATHFPTFNSWQVQNVSLFSLGIIHAESSQQQQIARQVATGERVDSAARRLRRFMGNDSIDMPTFFTEWTRWVMARMCGDEVILLVDETKLNDRLGVMVVGVAWEGRCLPLAWRCYKANSADDYPEEGQVGMIVALLRHIKAGMPAHKSVLLMADRGIGTSPDLCRAVDALGWRYLFRVTCQSKIVTETGDYTIAAMVEEGEVWSAQGRVFKQRGRIPARACAIWSVGYDEPWALVTNDPDLLGEEYGTRNWQEQSFRDLKSYGWQWEQSWVTDPHRMTRFMILLVIAYGWILSLGAYAVYDKGAHALQKHVSGEYRRYRSMFKEGLNWFTEFVRRNTVCLKLCFVPDKRLP